MTNSETLAFLVLSALGVVVPLVRFLWDGYCDYRKIRQDFLYWEAERLAQELDILNRQLEHHRRWQDYSQNRKPATVKVTLVRPLALEWKKGIDHDDQ